MSTDRIPPFWTITAYGALAATGGFLALLGASRELDVLVVVGGVGGFVALAALPLAMLMRRTGGAALGRIEHEVRELAGAVTHFTEQQALSDDARRVLHRDRERELLRKAIEEDIAAGEYEAALVLTRELAERFGYRADAEEFRKRIESGRAEHFDRAVATAIAQLDGLIIQRRWEAAHVQAARIARVYPDSLRVVGLPQRIEDARKQYRSDLEARFLRAAQAEQIEEAMSLLKELDSYLSPQEAEPYVEVARGVVGKARENLAAEFKLAKRDKRWRRAVEVGQRIIDEFPNSRMADEVRSIIDEMRSLAASAGAGAP